MSTDLRELTERPMNNTGLVFILTEQFCCIHRERSFEVYFKSEHYIVTTVPCSSHCSEHYQEWVAEVDVGVLVPALVVNFGLELVV